MQSVKKCMWKQQLTDPERAGTAQFSIVKKFQMNSTKWSMCRYRRVFNTYNIHLILCYPCKTCEYFKEKLQNIVKCVEIVFTIRDLVYPWDENFPESSNPDNKCRFEQDTLLWMGNFLQR